MVKLIKYESKIKLHDDAIDAMTNIIYGGCSGGSGSWYNSESSPIVDLKKYHEELFGYNDNKLAMKIDGNVEINGKLKVKGNNMDERIEKLKSLYREQFEKEFEIFVINEVKDIIDTFDAISVKYEIIEPTQNIIEVKTKYVVNSIINYKKYKNEFERKLREWEIDAYSLTPCDEMPFFDVVLMIEEIYEEDE